MLERGRRRTMEKRGRGRPSKKHKNQDEMSYSEPADLRQLHQPDCSTPMLNSIHVPFSNPEKRGRGRGRPLKKHKNEEPSSYTEPAQIHHPDPSTPLLNSMNVNNSINTILAKYSTRGLLALPGTTTETKPVATEVKNVNYVPHALCSLSPQMDVLAKNEDEADVIPSSEFPHAQESSSQAEASEPPHQNVDVYGLIEQVSSPPSTFNCTKIAEMVVNDSFDLNEDASKADLALVTVNGYQVKSSPPSSFNCTKIAEMAVNDSFDLDEDASKDDLALVTVNGYQVKSSPPSSFNCTKMAEMVVNDSFDLDEDASKADVALVTVNGYQVKEEMADLLKKIISKYGDIGQECIFRSTVQRSFQVEKVCEIYQKLGHTKFGYFTKMDMKPTIELVEDLESVKINVKWLRKRLDEIHEALHWTTEGYSALKEEHETSLIAIERKKEELSVMQEELGAMVANHQKLNEALVSTKNKIESFYGYHSLVDGLL